MQRLALVMLSLPLLASCAAQPPAPTPPAAPTTAAQPDPSRDVLALGPDEAGFTPEEVLGWRIFNDKNLSEPHTQSCATCHAQAFAFAADASASGPDHGLPVPLGGPAMDQPGLRNSIGAVRRGPASRRRPAR